MSRVWRAWRRYRSRRRVSGGGLVRACITIALCCLVLSAQAVAYSSPTSLNGIASWLAMRKVEIHCLTPEESEEDFTIAIEGAEAYVSGWMNPFNDTWHPFNEAVFKYGHCEALLAMMSGGAVPFSDYQQAWSVLVLVHESGHLRGHRWSGDEAKTQCWAMRHFRYTLTRLGVLDAERQSRLVAQAIRIHWTDMNPEYQLPGCVLPKA